MANEVAKYDVNNKPTAIAITDDSNQFIKNLRIDDTTKGLKVMIVGGTGTGTVTSVGTGTGLTGGPITGSGTITLDSKLAPLDTLGTAGQSIRVNVGATALEYYTPSSGGTGTVTSVSVVTANGFQGTVATNTTTPAITLSVDSSHYLPTTTDQTNWNAKGTGSVTAVSITTANGVSGSSSGGATPALTISLGAITPSTVNALTLASQTVGFTIAGGTTSKTLTVPLDASVSGTNTGDQTSVSGNAGTATKLAATKTINGVAFDGSANITVPSDIAPSTSGNVLTSNGSLWTSATPVNTSPTTSVFVGTRVASVASGAVTYAHGLGRVPKYCRISAMVWTSSGGTFSTNSEGGYDGTNNASIWVFSGASGGGSSSNGVSAYINSTASGQTGVITWDATNITITWTKISSPSETINLLFQVF